MKRNFTNFIKVTAITCALSLGILGCGGSDGAASYDSAGNMDYAAEDYYDSYNEEAVTESGVSEDSSTEAPEVKKSNRKLITNMSMSIETKEFDKILSFLESRTEALGGYVESMSIDSRYSDDRRYGSLTLRIPEENLDSFVNEVSEKSNITSQSKNVTDVTLTYADLESHKNALRAEEQQLLTLMQQATTIEEIMAVQEKLTDVRYQIESMESQLRTYDNQITYSTLTVSVEEVEVFTPEAKQTFMDEAKQGFVENVALIISVFRTIALLIITHIPTLILILIIAGIAILLVRAADKRHKKRMQNRGPRNMNPYPQQVPPVNQPSYMANGTTYQQTPPGNAAGTAAPANPLNGNNGENGNSQAPLNK